MRVRGLDKVTKKDLTLNKHVDNKVQPLEFAREGERCKELREKKSLWRWSIFWIPEIASEI